MTELDTLQIKVKALGENSFIKDNLPEKDVEKACVAYLKSLGYKVVSQVISYKVSTLDELIDLFYHLMDFHNNDVCSLVSNRKKDRSILATFITARQKELGYSFKDSLQDCANIINTLFVYEEELALTVPLGIWVFGSDKCKWITDKAINILNNTAVANSEAAVIKMAEEDEIKNSNEYTGFDFSRLRRIYG